MLRGLIVYAALLFLMRVSGKRQIGQLSPLDLVLLLIISNAVQNAMNGGDNSVTAGLILAGHAVRRRRAAWAMAPGAAAAWRRWWKAGPRSSFTRARSSRM